MLFDSKIYSFRLVCRASTVHYVAGENSKQWMMVYVLVCYLDQTFNKKPKRQLVTKLFKFNDHSRTTSNVK